VWLEGSGSTRPYYYQQKYFLERGIMPLDYREGNVRGGNSEDEIVDDWCSAWEEGYVGIAIDELGGYNFEKNRKFARALVRTKRRCPDLYIAVWHAGPLFRDLAEAYEEGADLVLLETYVSGTSSLSLRFGFKLLAARMMGIVDKSVFALGINDDEGKVRETGRGRWANSPDELRAQMQWINRYASDMPGIAIYASSGSLEMIRAADRLAGEIFLSK
jgi:hypothetical protein